MTAVHPAPGPKDQGQRAHDGAESCSICGGELGFDYRCHVCREWRCPVCEEPAYRDESVTYNALGKMHMRCSSGEPRPRPERMGDPMDVALKEPA